MPERKQGWYYRAARVSSQDKKGGDSLRGRSRKGAQEEDAEPWSADTAEDTVSPGSTMLAAANRLSAAQKDYGNIWDSHWVGTKGKEKAFLNARASPTEQFNTHSLSTS